MKMKVLLSATLISASLIATAQEASRTYAITGKDKNNFYWADIKQVDIATGKVVKSLFESEKTSFKSADLDKSIASVAATANPTGFGVAAAAFDSRTNRLYFAPMHFSDIKYLDLSSEEANFTTVKRNVIPLNTRAGAYQSEDNQLTRMVIAADGYGYAISNDGNHMIRFSTSKNGSVEDLGALIDAESNKSISCHNKCTSWGGDMVADAFGKLIVITANHNIFSIDINTRIATFTGTITGLPNNFTTNGAVVDDNGDLIVASATVFEGLYKVNLKDFSAVKMQSTEKPFNAADLANANMLNQKQYDAIAKFNTVKPLTASVATGSVYPNPVRGNQFNVLFEGQKAGTYSIVLTDLSGRALQSNVVNITKGTQTESVRLNNKIAHGMYLVKVLNEGKQIAFSDKIVIE